MTHNMLIVLHALAGVICFATGVLSLNLSSTRSVRSWRFRTFVLALGALLLFMVAVIAVDWADLDTGTRLVFLGLTGLGAYMAWRAWQAAIRLGQQPPGWREKYLNDVGFNLISLFDGFVIVAAIDLGFPVWVVALVAVGGVVAGILAMNQVKARLGVAPGRRLLGT